MSKQVNRGTVRRQFVHESERSSFCSEERIEVSGERYQRNETSEVYERDRFDDIEE